MENQLIVTLNVQELKELITESVKSGMAQMPVPKKEDDTLLKRKDVAKLLSVSLVTITQWMKSGKIPYHRISRRVYFKKGDIYKAMEGISQNACLVHTINKHTRVQLLNNQNCVNPVQD